VAWITRLKCCKNTPGVKAATELGLAETTRETILKDIQEEGTPPSVSSDLRFHVFGILGANKTGSQIQIFSIGTAVYLSTDDDNPMNDNGIMVVSWITGNWVNQDTWTFIKSGSGVVSIKNNYHKEDKMQVASTCKRIVWIVIIFPGQPSIPGDWQIQIMNE
jgi:hypothetical protein